MIMAWGAMGAALATMLAGIINGVIAYKVAQRFCPVEYEWRKLFAFYSLLIAAACWVLIGRMVIPDSYEIRLIGKFALIAGYIAIGYRYNQISIERIRMLMLPLSKLC